MNWVKKISVYSKRTSSEALGISYQQISPKKMKITQSPQIVDLEEEEPREQVNLDIVESGTSTVLEVKKESKLQSEGSSRTFSKNKYIFDRSSKETYQSKEDLTKQCVNKGTIALGEMRDLVPEVENISPHKSFLFIVRDVEKITFNITVSYEYKVFEINIRYDNISDLDKVKFHKHTNDMLYSDYLILSLKNSKLSSYEMKLEGHLRREKASRRAWQNQVKRMESEGPQGLKSLLDEKDKLIQSMKKKLKMFSTENPQTTELVSL
jgi:hypothetical protein